MESPLAAVSSKVVSTTSMPWRQALWRGTRHTNRSDAVASKDKSRSFCWIKSNWPVPHGRRAYCSAAVLPRAPGRSACRSSRKVLHVRRRPAAPGELIAATSRDDVGFAATGPTDLMIVVLPTSLIDRWVQTRRGIDRFDLDLPSPRWQVPADEMARRARTLSGCWRRSRRIGDLLTDKVSGSNRRFST